MTQKGFKRKLAAILSADVAGYSRLMGDDEEATIRTITAYRNAMTDLIQQYRGRLVDATGDNLLAEFVSVVDAVNCAVEIQRELAERNAELSDNRKMEFRIGVNLGDVVEEEGRIYGDGVNISARVESLAEAGGICISGRAYDQVENKLGLEYENLGEHNVKNIARPIRVYRVLFYPGASAHRVIHAKEAVGKKWRKNILAALALVVVGAVAFVVWNSYFRLPPIKPAFVEKMAHPLPDKPSIAVLPFDNLSGDPNQEYFSDGMTEDLITDLSKISGLFVIARNSTFQYKGKAVDVKRISHELGIRYVLEGSVRKAEDRVRINAQLIDATTGGHIWAERYDRDLKDIFALQDEVTQKIITALEVRLTEDEQKRIVHKYTNDMAAYDFYLQGMEYLNQQSKKGNLQARKMFEKAIEQDSKFALAYAFNGLSHLLEWSMGWGRDPQSVEKAFVLAKKAVALDDSLPTGHALLGDVYLWKKKYEQAIAEQKKAVALDPNDADVLAGLSVVLSWSGEPQESVGLVKKAMRLNPRYPIWYLWALGHAYFLTEQHDIAIKTFKKVLNRDLDYMPAHAYLASIYIEQGRNEEAWTEVAEVERLSPQISLDDWKQRLPYKDQSVLARLIDSLREAGLK